MNPPPKKRPVVSPEEWLTHARSDLKMARLGREDEEILAVQTCFHAQQAVEKSLKAVLLFSKVDFPLTHDIQDLIEIIEASSISLPEDLKEVDVLTPYAVESRYPGYWEVVTDQDVDEALNLADKVVKWAGAFISQK